MNVYSEKVLMCYYSSVHSYLSWEGNVSPSPTQQQLSDNLSVGCHHCQTEDWHWDLGRIGVSSPLQ